MSDISISPLGIRAAVAVQRLQFEPESKLSNSFGEAELNYALEHNKELLRERPISTAGLQPKRSALEVRGELAKLWLERHRASLQDASKLEGWLQSLPASSRMLIAEYLAAKQDAQCIPFYEACFKEWEKQHTDTGTGAIQKINGAIAGVHPLAWYYQDIGDWRKAAETYLLSEKYSTSAVWVSAALVEAARAYERVDEGKKAQEIRGRIGQYRTGWYTILSARDQAAAMIDAGQFEAARKVLGQTIESTELVREGQIAQNTWLAQLAYNQGNKDEAIRFSQEALELSERYLYDNSPSMAPTIHSLAVQAREVHLRAGGANVEPIQTQVREVTFRPKTIATQQPLYARFRVQIFGSATLSATADNPKIQVRVLPVKNWRMPGHTPNFVEKEVIIIMPDSTFRESSHVVLESLGTGGVFKSRVLVRPESVIPAK